jgi:hypothetical protein
MDNLLLVKQSSGKIRQIATVIPLSLAPLQAASNCPVWSGIGVQFALERVSSLPWNECPVWRGLGVQFAVEYARWRYRRVGCHWEERCLGRIGKTEKIGR